MKILFVSPEAAPYAKTGGLADVAGALPAALQNLGAEVKRVLPLYRMVREAGFDLRRMEPPIEVSVGPLWLRAHLFETRTDDGVPVYFIEREDLFDRPNLYGNPEGDYYDNLERFAFFCHASLKLSQLLSFEPDIIHCHDWQTGLIPALIKGPYKDFRPLRRSRTVFTIHNLGYQGLFSPAKLPFTGLPYEGFFRMDGLEYYGNICLLKAGIAYAEAITTVSPKYSREIQTLEYGKGMEGILRRRAPDLHGILNGVDYRVWDPATDPLLPANYSPADMAGKAKCKKALLDELALDRAFVKRPLLGMISRLDTQKGLDLLVEILEQILSLNTALVILASGEEDLQKAIEDAAYRHPGQVGLGKGFNEPLAHRIMAGSDLFLIPSRYEPCGLTQMYALKYGTVPVVRATGGLDDTVVQFDPSSGTGNGFKFGPYDPGAFLVEIQRAVSLFPKKSTWATLMANGMKEDFSWEHSAKIYLELFSSVLERHPR